MSSFSRHTCRAHFLLRPRALGAALVLALASGAAVAGGAHRFVFTAYTDAAGGAEVAAGRYRAALEELQSHPDVTDLDPSATNTNRCVAYSMTLQRREAHAACDAAVLEADGQPIAWGGTQGFQDEHKALAYANRAVMHWLFGEGAAAASDIAKARELAPRTDFVAQNIAALEMHVTVARAAAPASRS